MYRRRLATIMTNAIATVERGCQNGLDYRMFFKNGTKFISPWHDIPLYSNEEKQIFNMVCEIPRWTNAKLEIATKEKLNPFKQDVKNNKLRYVDNCFPHHGYIWNYGAFPQTWEDPTHVDPETQAKGDNDPIDVIEIGQKIAQRGEVMQVKVLGTLALIDEGETDWKIVTIDVNDPLAAKLSDITDVEKFLPGLLSATVDWFRIYKIPAGKPENKFAFDGQFKNKEYALNVIKETNDFWRALVTKQENEEGLFCAASVAEECQIKLTEEDTNAIISATSECGPTQPIPESVHKWHFIKS